MSQQSRPTSNGCAIHDLVFGDGFTLVVLVRWRAGSLASDDGELHMLDLDSNEQKVDLADDNVL